MGEFDLIKNYFAPLAGPEGLGLMDDAACLTPEPGCDLVLTKDTMVEGVHFPSGHYGEDVARRLIRVNLSDLAAKGAAPKGYLLSIAWPRAQAGNIDQHCKSFAQGLRSDQDLYDFHLYGGDTVSTDGPMVVSATFIGQVPSGQMIKRSEAQIGNDVWVTGSLGSACLGLKVIVGDETVKDVAAHTQAKWLEAYWRPEPCLGLAELLKGLATASADISDGLLSDLGHIAKACDVGFEVDFEAIPFDEDVCRWARQQGNHAFMELLTFGDDYQLVFTAPHHARSTIVSGARAAGTDVARIGICAASKTVNLRGDKGQLINIDQSGYVHF